MFASTFSFPRSDSGSISLFCRHCYPRKSISPYCWQDRKISCRQSHYNHLGVSKRIFPKSFVIATLDPWLCVFFQSICWTQRTFIANVWPDSQSHKCSPARCKHWPNSLHQSSQETLPIYHLVWSIAGNF